AARAGLADATVDVVAVEAADAHAFAHAAHAGIQVRAHEARGGGVERGDLRDGQRADVGERAGALDEERLALEDVADAGGDALIEEDLTDLAAAGTCALGGRGGIEVVGEDVGAE